MAEQPPSGWQVRGSMPLSSFELPQSGHSVQREDEGWRWEGEILGVIYLRVK